MPLKHRESDGGVESDSFDLIENRADYCKANHLSRGVLPKDSFENFDNMRGEGYWSIISWDGLTVLFVKMDDMRQFVGSRDISISQEVRPNEVDGNCDIIFAIFEKCSRHFIRHRGSILVNFVNCSYNVIDCKFHELVCKGNFNWA